MKSKKIAVTALVITILTLLSKFIGFYRDILIAKNYGTSINTDAYVMSQSIIGIATTVIITSLTVAFIPLLTDYKENKTEVQYRSFINNVYTITLVLTVFVSILVFLFSSNLVSLFAPGFTGVAAALTVKILRIMTPIVCLSAVVLLNNSYLQSRGRFYIPTLIGYPSNIALIFTMIFLTEKFGIIGLAWSFTVGALLQVLFQVVSLHKADFILKFECDLNNDGLKALLVLVIPTIIGSGVNIVNTTVDRMIGSTLIQGSVSALNFSNRLSMFVLGIVGASITTVFYTSMSNHSAQGNSEDFKVLLKGTINTLNLIIIPASIGFIVLSKPIVQFVFARGAFDQSATVMTASCLVFYSIGLVSFALRDVMTRSFYSIQDTMTPMINGVIAVVLNIILNITLSKFMGVSGLALATSISGIVTTILLMIFLKKKIGSFGLVSISKTFGKIMISSLMMGLIVYFANMYLAQISNNFIIGMAVSVLLGVIAYGVIISMLKVDEFNSLLKSITVKIRSKVS